MTTEREDHQRVEVGNNDTSLMNFLLEEWPSVPIENMRLATPLRRDTVDAFRDDKVSAMALKLCSRHSDPMCPLVMNKARLLMPAIIEFVMCAISYDRYVQLFFTERERFLAFSLVLQAEFHALPHLCNKCTMHEFQTGRVTIALVLITADDNTDSIHFPPTILLQYDIGQPSRVQPSANKRLPICIFVNTRHEFAEILLLRAMAAHRICIFITDQRADSDDLLFGWARLTQACQTTGRYWYTTPRCVEVVQEDHRRQSVYIGMQQADAQLRDFGANENVYAPCCDECSRENQRGMRSEQ